SGREATDNLAQSVAKMKEATSTELHQLTQRFNQLEEKRLKQLGMDVQALQGALVHVQTELQKEVVIPDHILREIDAKSARFPIASLEISCISALFDERKPCGLSCTSTRRPTLHTDSLLTQA
ncbi:unnamed protein product, partial [Symbiodinium microadriaticum]